MVKTRQNFHGRNLRKGRISEPGRIYVITTVTRNRKPVFADFFATRTLIQVLMGHDQLGFAKTLCFVVMPDHLHWMMQLGEIKTLGETIHALKSITSRRVGKAIFQKGYYDHAVREEKDIKELARYICCQSVKGGTGEGYKRLSPLGRYLDVGARPRGR